MAKLKQLTGADMIEGLRVWEYFIGYNDKPRMFTATIGKVTPKRVYPDRPDSAAFHSSTYIELDAVEFREWYGSRRDCLVALGKAIARRIEARQKEIDRLIRDKKEVELCIQELR